MKDRKGLDLDGRGREQLGGVGREETIIRKYNVRKTTSIKGEKVPESIY